MSLLVTGRRTIILNEQSRDRNQCLAIFESRTIYLSNLDNSISLGTISYYLKCVWVLKFVTQNIVQDIQVQVCIFLCHVSARKDGLYCRLAYAVGFLAEARWAASGWIDSLVESTWASVFFLVSSSYEFSYQLKEIKYSKSDGFLLYKT
jgi:hypothetical protein